jgi:putative membrane-bound dehydrogenase-like protein
MTYKKIISYIIVFIIISCQSEASEINQKNIQYIGNDDIDREYVLEATMIGYTGIGGEIDGILNPVLRAEEGDVVKITIINGELMPHDIVMEEHDVASEVIIEDGATTSIIFTARFSDTYFCSIPGHRAAGMEGQFEVVDNLDEEIIVQGFLPEKDGRVLNLNFEDGSLTDWTATGNAFEGQPILSDPSPMHQEEMRIGSQGEYFITSGGTSNHETTGTLTSIPFEVTHPYASFMVSGGALEETRVEIVNWETEEVIFQITGNNHATLRPVVVDLNSYLGDEIFVRIIDNESGIVPEIAYIQPNIWAHINFDNFQFHDERPEYQNELRPSEIIILPPRDIITHAGLSAEEAARNMDVPEGFSVNLAASEPDIVRPIALAMDEKSRLWIVEANTYPVRAPEGEGQDRILIFEDTNGDGKLDKQTIFIEGLNLVSGIEVGFGGVWVGAAPYLLYIPIDDDGYSPAGEPEIVLDGWGYQDTHETLNSFQWGPDGWLYGVHGVFTHSNVGKPGASEDERERINAGVWRYHPQHHEFEVYAHGTSNPWGIDFNDYGHPFITVCVIPHLFHVIRGARYHRQSGNHFNEYTYDDITTIADHVHWIGDRGPHAGNFRSGRVGGGHAHAGAMFYLGSENWGQDRNKLFMNNLHGVRVNTDRIERKGSGYTATHGEDFLLTNDTWSQWLNFRYGPDGSVFAIDWYDKNQCHHPDPEVHDRTLGRIFRISHEKDQWVKIDLSNKTNSELVELQLHNNEWYVRNARRLLQERGTDSDVHEALWEIFEDHPEIPRKLRALWALHVTDGLLVENLRDMLGHSSEYIRSWAIQLLMDVANPSDDLLEQFAVMARNDESALVRLQISSALQNVDLDRRWDILEGLAGHVQDADDHNLPMMVWYAAEPLAEVDPDRAMELALDSPFPNLVAFTSRRIADSGTALGLQALESSLGKTENHDHIHTIQVAIDNFQYK